MHYQHLLDNNKQNTKEYMIEREEDVHHDDEYHDEHLHDYKHSYSEYSEENEESDYWIKKLNLDSNNPSSSRVEEIHTPHSLPDFGSELHGGGFINFLLNVRDWIVEIISAILYFIVQGFTFIMNVAVVFFTLYLIYIIIKFILFAAS